MHRSSPSAQMWLTDGLSKSIKPTSPFPNIFYFNQMDTWDIARGSRKCGYQVIEKIRKFVAFLHVQKSNNKECRHLFSDRSPSAWLVPTFLSYYLHKHRLYSCIAPGNRGNLFRNESWNKQRLLPGFNSAPSGAGKTGRTLFLIKSEAPFGFHKVFSL